MANDNFRNNKETYRYHYNYLNKNIVFKLIAFGAIYFPKYLADEIGRIIAAFLYFILKDVRTRQYKNIRHILGNGADERQVRLIALKVWRNWSKYLLDFFRFSNLNNSNLHSFVAEIKGMPNFSQNSAHDWATFRFQIRFGIISFIKPK